MAGSGKTEKKGYLDALGEGIIVFDGAMGTGLQKLGITEEDFGDRRYAGCYDYLVIGNPKAVEHIHREYLETGVDVIETNTFRSNRYTLSEFGLSDRTFDINQKAAELAAHIASEYSTPRHPRFVAGSMGPSGFLPSSGDPRLSRVTFDELVSVFSQQASGLMAGGVDLLLIETSQDILEVKAAVAGCLKAFETHERQLPLQVQVTLDVNGRMLLGTDIEAVLAILEDLPVDVIGLNCSTGPQHMRHPVEFLCRYSSKPVSAVPNAGMPVNRGGEAYYPLEPEEFAAAMEDFAKNLGVNVIGGCCGTTPEHLAALIPRVRGVVPPPRPGRRDGGFLASGIHALRMRQEPAPLIIGERCNPQGSGLFKKALIDENLDAASEIARTQTDNGAHALDVASSLSERRDEKSLMERLVHRFAADGIDAPLVIDTTDGEVMEAALKMNPGRCMLNSTNLEGGPEKAKKVFTLARTYNAAVMMLTIDEEGMAKTVERKLSIARRLYRMAVDDHGLRPESLVFDLLTFSLATGEAEYAESASMTIKAIRELKRELPGVHTSLGISNVSFGFGKHARKVLNSIFLYHTVQAGLDMAIVHPAAILPYPEVAETERKLAEDLLFCTRPDALTAYIEYFESRGENADTGNISDETEADPALFLRNSILKRSKKGLKEAVGRIIGEAGAAEASAQAVRTINEVLLPAMKDVGERFGRGEIILPFVLQSAEVMKEAVGLLEVYLEKGGGPSRGKIVLATVAGDVHDIGKNLVKTILSNNGYTVIDLGKQVPVETIVEAAQDHKADAVGLSALLVSTSLQMKRAVGELAERNMSIPVLVGGAAINREFADEISILDNGSRYAGDILYCRDAFDGLTYLEALMKNKPPKESGGEKIPVKAGNESRPVRGSGNIPPSVTTSSARPVPEAPFLGYRRLDIPLEKIVERLNRKQLFMLNWGAGKLPTEKRQEPVPAFEKILDTIIDGAVTGRHITPKALYGFFPALSEGEHLLIMPPEDPLSKEPLVRFHFPPGKDGRPSVASAFKPVGSTGYDIAMFQIVTCGAEATARFDTLQRQDRYTEAYYFHGFSVQAAEAAAQYVFEIGLESLGLSGGSARRISWGYPAAPDLGEHAKLFRILPAAEELDMHLTSAYQFVPEQSTAAVVVYKNKLRGIDHEQ